MDPFVDMSVPAIAAAFAVTMAAGLMRGFAGVGSGILMAPFFAVLFGPVATVTVIMSMEIVVTAQLLPATRRHIDWRVIGPMAGAAALAMPIGTWALLSLDPDVSARVIGGVVLVFAAVLLRGWRYDGAKPLPATVAVGGFSSALMALTSLGNPPAMVYLLSGRDNA